MTTVSVHVVCSECGRMGDGRAAITDDPKADAWAAVIGAGATIRQRADCSIAMANGYKMEGA